jgi:Sulfotransferase family
MTSEIPPPIAIGGIGGSGTRVAATLLEFLGYYLGDDLNEALDNLWFTLLFKRRSVLLESDDDFGQLVRLFFRRMSSNTTLSEADRAVVFKLAEQGRLQHDHDWLLARAVSFNGVSLKKNGQPWCWKEPNTHIIIERIFLIHPELRYLHIVRHPLNMSISANQSQLQNWGPVFLNRDVSIEPRHSLAYWCEAHRRVLRFARRWPTRTMVIDFDALCAEPDAYYAKIIGFLGISPPDDVLARFRKFIIKPASVSRHKGIDLAQFEPKDLTYLQEVGYSPVMPI